jgi:hypothetical protein
MVIKMQLRHSAQYMFLFLRYIGRGHRWMCQSHSYCEAVTWPYRNESECGYSEEQTSCSHGNKKSVLASLIGSTLAHLRWLREEHRLRVLENRVPRMILGPKSDGRTREWRKLHNKVLRDLYSSPSIISIIKSRRMRWAGHVARMGEKRKANRLLVRSCRSNFNIRSATYTVCIFETSAISPTLTC